MQKIKLLRNAIRQEYRYQLQEPRPLPATVGEYVALLTYEMQDLIAVWATSQSEYFTLRKLLRILTLIVRCLLAHTAPEDLIYHR